MEALALRTALRDEVKLDSSTSSENRGVRAWNAVEMPGKYWIQARRTEVGPRGQLEHRQWLTCDFYEALRYGRGENVSDFSLFVGVFTPSAASGFVFGEVTEVLRSVPSGSYFVRYGNGFSIMLSRTGDGEDLTPTGFEPFYRADAWRTS
jgi:hypothetical protein